MDLEQLRLRSREAADMVNSDEFISNDELNFYINQSLYELRDVLVTSYGQYYPFSTASLSILSGADTAALPADCYKVMGVDILVQSPNQFMTLNEFNFNERNLFNGPNQIYGTVSNWWTNIRYSIRGREIWITPTPNQNITLRLWYIPNMTELVADSDEVPVNDAMAGWLQYVITDCAIKMKQKEEDDVSVLMMQKEALRQRIIKSCTTQNAGSPKTISDRTRTGNNGLYIGSVIPGSYWGV